VPARRLASPCAGLTALAALAVLIPGCARSPGSGAPAEPPPIVLISIDTLRADRLPAWGYRGVATPAIDRLAADAVRFENAYAHYPLTLPSHVTLLSGRLPPAHGVRDNVGYRVPATAGGWLPSLLSGRGDPTAAFVSAYVLRGDTGFATGFDRFDAPLPVGEIVAIDAVQRPGAATVAAAKEWLAGRGPGPWFLFVHLYEPHTPYAPPEPYRSAVRDPYDGEVAAADAAVGELLDALRARGLYEQALIVLVSDHGEGLGDHDEREHGVLLYRSTLHVPLLVKLPGQARAGETVARPVGLADVAPTLARLAGLPPLAGADGLDLFEANAGAERTLYAETWYPRLHFGWSELRAAIEPRWYLLDGPRAELFDLERDPGQLRDVLAGHRSERARLLAFLDAHDAPLAAPSRVDEETARRLAALGYLSAPPVERGGAAPDPRTRRASLALYQEALAHFWAGRDDDAIAGFRRLLEVEPRMADGWGFLARLLDRAGRAREALAAWREVLTLSGGRGPVAATVAERLIAVGEHAEARALAAALAASDPVRALELEVEIDIAAGDRAGAEARLRAARDRGVVSEPLARTLALDALGAGDSRAALDWLDALGAAPAEPTRVVRSLALADAGRAAEAEAELEAARAASADPAGFFESLGVALLELERFEKARAALEESVRLRPGLATAWNSLGVARLRAGGPGPARAAWRRAVELDPGLADAWRNLGLVAAAAGDAAEARRALARYLDLVPPGRDADGRRSAERALAALPAR